MEMSDPASNILKSKFRAHGTESQDPSESSIEWYGHIL